MFKFINKILDKIIKELTSWNRFEQEELNRALYKLIPKDKYLTPEESTILSNIIVDGGACYLHGDLKLTCYKEANMYMKIITDNKSLWNNPELLYEQFKKELL